MLYLLKWGVCPTCDYFKRLSYVDWQERFDILKDLLLKFPRKSGQYFDCIIGVSGGKDGSRQALWVRDTLGLKPLLVCLSYPPLQVTERGVDNISNLIELKFDIVLSAPALGVWKSLMQESFECFTNWTKSTELALFSSVPQIAIRCDIPLILCGGKSWAVIGRP